MQNIERYYGFRVALTDDLDPMRVDFLMERARAITALYDYDADQFHVYLHRMTISNLKSVHFGTRGLSERLEQLEVTFAVNQKQVRSRKIRLFNYLVDEQLDPGIQASQTAYSITYRLPVDFLARRESFSNEIITFIARDLRDKHRKIKASFLPVPTPSYRSLLRNRGISSTKIDFRFRRPVTLRPPREGNSVDGPDSLERRAESRVLIQSNTYQFFGAVGSVGDGTHVNLAESADLIALVEELRRVAEVGYREGELGEEEVGALGTARRALETGNREGASRNLAGLGKRVLDVAEKVGASVVVAWIKQEMGLG